MKRRGINDLLLQIFAACIGVGWGRLIRGLGNTGTSMCQRVVLYTPCRTADTEEQALALAVVHTELVLIHPFREGNGRCARLVAVLMGLQAGLPALNFAGVRGEEKQRYFAAVQAGLDRNYVPMASIFRRIVSRTLRLRNRAIRG